MKPATNRFTGRSYSSRYAASGISDRFIAGAGFISRPGIAHVTQEQQFTWYGHPGALVESFTFAQFDDLMWQYRKLFNHGDAIEKKWHFSTGAALRGGWVEGPETAELVEPYEEWAGLASVYLLAGFSRGLIPLSENRAADRLPGFARKHVHVRPDNGSPLELVDAVGGRDLGAAGREHPEPPVPEPVEELEQRTG